MAIAIMKWLLVVKSKKSPELDMNPITHEITIYEAMYDDRVYLTVLSYDEAKSCLTTGHYAFGKRGLTPYKLGDHWATTPEESGWRIVERRVPATYVKAKRRGEFHNDETVHLGWTCPFCKQPFSENLKPSDKSPMLLMCSCNKVEKFFLADF